jgi:pilus assembly protein CpaB
MNKNILIVLGGGFLIAVLVAMMVQASLRSGQKKQTTVKQEPRVEILVAAKSLPAGQILNDEVLKWQVWPASAVFSGAVKREGKNQLPTEAISGRLKRDFSNGEPILKNGVVSASGNLIAASLREGMRAVTIDAKSAALVNGFINPGDYVDLMLTHRVSLHFEGDSSHLKTIEYANLTRFATETFMENVRILAVDSRTSNVSSGDDKKAKTAKSITVETTKEGAEYIALARKMGDISIALRSVGDNDVSESYRPAVTDGRLSNVWDEIFMTHHIYKNSMSSGGSIRVYNGSNVSKISK